MSPAEATRWLRDDPRPFALVGEWLGTEAILGSAPSLVASPREDPFAVLDAAMRPAPGEARVGGGWVGWLGYGLGGEVEELPPSPPAPCPRPRFSLAFHDHVVVRDEDGWWFEELWTPEREPVLATRLRLWRSRLAGPAPAARAVAVSPVRIAGNGGAGHLAAVSECRSRIAAGELFQANLCLRLEGTFDGALCDVFSAAVASSPPRFGAWVDGTVSLSPERFLRRSGDRVSSEPIKGTRPRVAGGDERAAREALETSAKDAAEHVMIVDLMRNDLGRVCRYGSVQAHARRVEAHAGVWHLVSEVSGRLRDGVGDGALLRATFPPGSVTGAPKVQAMKVIAELEGTRRELYTGAIGIAGPVAGLELSVAIRTFETSGSRIWLGVGGGIVADSDPEEELAEALAKAAGPLAAIGGRLGPSPPRAPAAGRLPRALVYGDRPDPRAGVFETILVQAGQPVALDAHLARLTASLDTLYGRVPPADLRARIAAAVAATAGERSRLRIGASRSGAISLSTVPAPAAAPAPALLAPFVLPGGLGAHKWIDRALLDALSRVPRGAVPLLVDSDGLVLEAAFANVWILEHGTWLTPPADGRILPGVTRATRLRTDPSAREEPVAFTRLCDATQIEITSSIGGARPAACDRAEP
jgi:para-aminobenzoate synthetase/4-amino-4-deoxychorismate lyase